MNFRNHSKLIHRLTKLMLPIACTEDAELNLIYCLLLLGEQKGEKDERRKQTMMGKTAGDEARAIKAARD
jgi:hypothetical protein